MIEYALPFIFSSDPSSGAQNVSQDGSSFVVEFSRPISIPRLAKNVYVTVQSVVMWWNTHNVILNENDQIWVEYFDGVDTMNEILSLEAGLYDLDHLSSEVSRELHQSSLPSDLFIFTPDSASGKVVIQYNYEGVQLDFTQNRNLHELLGFDERLIPATGQTTGVQFERGDRVAQFNTVEYFLIHSSLVSTGLKINNIYSNVVSQVLIDVPPGSQIISAPFNVPRIPSPDLIGSDRKNLRFWLTDDKGQSVDTNGEFFSLRLIIHYSMSEA